MWPWYPHQLLHKAVSKEFKPQHWGWSSACLVCPSADSIPSGIHQIPWPKASEVIQHPQKPVILNLMTLAMTNLPHWTNSFLVHRVSPRSWLMNVAVYTRFIILSLHTPQINPMSNPILLGQAVTLQWCTTHGPSYLTFTTSFMFLVYCGFAIYAIKWARWLIPLVTVTPYLKHLAQIVFQERRRLLSGWIYKKEKKNHNNNNNWSLIN